MNESITITKHGKKQCVGTGEVQKLWIPDHVPGTLKITVNGAPSELSGEAQPVKDLSVKTHKPGDLIVITYDYLESTSTWSVEFEEFLESIGGLVNGYRTDDTEPITDRHFFSVNDGWLNILKDLINELIVDGWDKQICQVKEKFGGLRFYTNGGGPNHHAIIRKYEELAYITCEKCGEPGKPRSGGWILTLCDKHDDERESKG